MRKIPLPLPSTAQEVADIIGREATLILATLVAVHGPRGIYVPHKMPENHWIVCAIGKELSAKLWREFHGMYVPLSKCWIIGITARNEAIKSAYSTGDSISVIASRFGITYQRVYQIVTNRTHWRKESTAKTTL